MVPFPAATGRVGLLKPEDAEATLEGRDADIAKIQKQLLWMSSNLLSYPFKNNTHIEYHELCKWVGEKMGVDDWTCRSQPTFILERAIAERVWASIWDKLTPDQRKELLDKLQKETPQASGTSLDTNALVTMSGTAALATLATSVYFAGFAFYTTMSVTICTVAGWLGVTLPFAVYTTASSIVGFLSGPVGWAIIAVGVIASVAMLGKADVQKTAAFIMQIHFLKAMALQTSGEAVPNVPVRQ